jgi:predicted nucleotide-binding protein
VPVDRDVCPVATSRSTRKKPTTRKLAVKAEPAAQATPANKRRKTYVSQADVPRHPISEALRVARAIAGDYGKQPTRPLDVAVAMGIAPTSGSFKMLTGASIAYGFTEGGAQADEISLTDLGMRVVAPMEEGDDEAAKREALLRPRVVREFLEKYDGSKLPRPNIGRNVLEQMSVTATATERTLDLIIESANELGLLTEIKGESYVNLKVVPKPKDPDADLLYDEDAEDAEDAVPPEGLSSADLAAAARIAHVEVRPTAVTTKANRRVFISHGKNKRVVSQLKELLNYGDFEPVVSVERETASKPVPDKVMDDMRSCGAGIIHVGTERKVKDDDGNEHQMLNQNVLIEIGAAMALYEGRFILLVEKGTTLPSNLQGLYEVRFEGEGLDHDATMRLLKAFNDFKS